MASISFITKERIPFATKINRCEKIQHSSCAVRGRRFRCQKSYKIWIEDEWIHFDSSIEIISQRRAFLINLYRQLWLNRPFLCVSLVIALRNAHTHSAENWNNLIFEPFTVSICATSCSNQRKWKGMNSHFAHNFGTKIKNVAKCVSKIHKIKA